MKSIELLIVLMALSSSSATASSENQARADLKQQPPAMAAPVRLVARTAPTGKTSVYKPADGDGSTRQTSSPPPQRQPPILLTRSGSKAGSVNALAPRI